MELKKILLALIFFSFTNSLNCETILPKKMLTPYDVIKIQLTALKNNNNPLKDSGIKQTWIFAHPKNKKVTGPFERFRIMLYGDQYRFLLNHSSHQIKLIMNTPKKYIYNVEILTKDKKLILYEWHLEVGSEVNCKDCWFTSAVSIPSDQGNTI